MAKFSVRLATPVHEMAREEICKQLPFLSKSISHIEFSENGDRIDFEAPADSGKELTPHVENVVRRVQRALRDLRRKVVYRSSEFIDPKFAGDPEVQGVTFGGPGQAIIEGLPLRLLRYFDRMFEHVGARWSAIPLRTPALVPSAVLARCDYFRSFPQYVTFATHLREDAGAVEAFRVRHEAQTDVDGQALQDMETPRACLSPALCYHVYHYLEGRTLPSPMLAYGVCGPCFRYESSNLTDLRRLWEFTLREIVFLGGRQEVLQARTESIEILSEFLETHALPGEIRTASDPFFVAPDAISKTYFQLTSEAKFEVSLLLPGGERTAVASHNYHTDFFGRAFDVKLEDGGYMHSVCVGFGLERLVFAFLCRHGNDVTRWPLVVRNAPEFTERI